MAITAELWQANLIALVSAFLAIKVLRPIAIYFNLVDIPAGRKQHVGHIPGSYIPQVTLRVNY